MVSHAATCLGGRRPTVFKTEGMSVPVGATEELSSQEAVPVLLGGGQSFPCPSRPSPLHLGRQEQLFRGPGCPHADPRGTHTTGAEDGGSRTSCWQAQGTLMGTHLMGTPSPKHHHLWAEIHWRREGSGVSLPFTHQGPGLSSWHQDLCWEDLSLLCRLHLMFCAL